MKLHSTRELKTTDDLVKMWNKLKKEIAIIEATPNTAWVASFMHLCAGYDCGYYG